MAHWHDSNPWADSIVYVPVEELAAAVSGGRVRLGHDGPVVDNTAERLLGAWHAYGERFDAYVLPREDGLHSVGVRYGPLEGDYLSPAPHDPEAVRRLVARHASSAPGLVR